MKKMFYEDYIKGILGKDIIKYGDGYIVVEKGYNIPFGKEPCDFLWEPKCKLGVVVDEKGNIV